MIENAEIDNGKGFDWGRTSADYGNSGISTPKRFTKKHSRWGFAQKASGCLISPQAPGCCRATFTPLARTLPARILQKTKFPRHAGNGD